MSKKNTINVQKNITKNIELNVVSIGDGNMSYLISTFLLEVIILPNKELSNSNLKSSEYDWGYPIIKKTEEFVEKYNELKSELKRLESEQSTT